MDYQKQQEIRWNIFVNTVDRIYRVFGMEPPNKPVKDAIWPLVSNIPDDAWLYIERNICAMNEKPKNLGKCMYALAVKWRDSRANRQSYPGGRAIAPSGGRHFQAPKSPIGDRVAQIRRNNPGLSTVQALGMALAETKGVPNVR